MLFVLFEGNFLRQVVDVPVDPHPDIAALAGGLELLLVGALPAADDRGQNLHPGPLGVGEQLVDHLVHRLLLDLPAADGAVGDADPGVEKPQVVVNLGHRPDGRAGVFAGGLLVDGNSGGEPFDRVDVRLFHLPEKHPGVGRQALDIPPLPVGIDGVKRQRRLARPRQPGEDDQLVPRDFEVYIFQVVLPRTFYHNFVHFFPFPTFFFSARRGRVTRSKRGELRTRGAAVFGTDLAVWEVGRVTETAVLIFLFQ